MSADEFLHALLGDDASLKPLTHLLIARTEGNPFFLEESVRTLVETGVLVGERWGLSPGAGPADHPGPRHRAGGAGGAYRPVATGGEAAPADGCRDWHRGAPPPACRPLPSCRRRCSCTAASHTCRPPSFSTRRGSSPSANTPSSMP